MIEKTELPGVFRVIDEKYGSLLVRKVSDETMKWEDAKKAATALGEGWDLPDRIEGSLLARHWDELSKELLLGVEYPWIWTNEESAYDRTDAWFVDMSNGYVNGDVKHRQDRVLAVSAFQKLDLESSAKPLDAASDQYTVTDFKNAFSALFEEMQKKLGHAKYVGIRNEECKIGQTVEIQF